MKRFLLILFSPLALLLLLFAPCAAQTSPQQQQQAQTAMCASSSITDAPALFNLRLGMKPAQVKAVFGKSLKLNVKREGTFFQNFIDKPPPAFLPGVRALYLRFFNAALFQIEVFYADEGNRTTARRFVQNFSASLALPDAALWENRFERYKLTCGDFSLAADAPLNPRVELTDEAARALFEASQAKNKRKH